MKCLLRAAAAPLSVARAKPAVTIREVPETKSAIMKGNFDGELILKATARSQHIKLSNKNTIMTAVM